MALATSEVRHGATHFRSFKVEGLCKRTLARRATRACPQPRTPPPPPHPHTTTRDTQTRRTAIPNPHPPRTPPNPNPNPTPGPGESNTAAKRRPPTHPGLSRGVSGLGSSVSWRPVALLARERGD